MTAARRFLAIAACVCLAHAAALWALLAGLSPPPAQVFVPVTLMADVSVSASPAAPAATTAAAVTGPVQKTLRPDAQSRARQATPALLPQPTPMATMADAATPSSASAAPAPSSTAATGRPDAPAAGVTATTATATATTATTAVGAAALTRIELPSSDADYLQNPKPAYPPLSRRLGEQGKVVVRVFIGVNGLPQKAELHQSSGYERLDQAALATVLTWRYVPGKRGGAPEAMGFNVPLNFILE